MLTIRLTLGTVVIARPINVAQAVSDSFGPMPADRVLPLFVSTSARSRF
ncbi:MAG TPA: hypothetical protein H9902_03345 [Candidatus Stackebrandtia faecavium]|nr:hypothetical protein [Candidatus Stackebrandtia faecavium]